MNNRLLLGLFCVLTSTLAQAQQVHLDVRSGDGKLETHTFSTSGAAQWDTTKEYKFDPSSGDCSRSDLSQIKSSERVGRRISVQTSSFGADELFIRLEYENIRLAGFSPYRASPECVVNIVTTKGALYSGTHLLRKGEPQTVDMLSLGGEQLTLTFR